VIKTMQDALSDLKSGQLRLPEGTLNFAQLTDLLGLSKWHGVDDRFGDQP
jgi:hypothetical protein